MATMIKGPMAYAQTTGTGRGAGAERDSVGPALGLVLAGTTSLVLWVVMAGIANWLARAVF